MDVCSSAFDLHGRLNSFALGLTRKRNPSRGLRRSPLTQMSPRRRRSLRRRTIRPFLYATYVLLGSFQAAFCRRCLVCKHNRLWAYFIVRRTHSAKAPQAAGARGLAPNLLIWRFDQGLIDIYKRSIDSNPVSLGSNYLTIGRSSVRYD